MKIIILIFLFLTNVNAFLSSGQESVAKSKHELREDSAAINALVLYPDSIRRDIFETCLFPGAIENIASLQKNSSKEFAELIGNRSKDEMEDFWNLSRYPGLISKLVLGGKKSKEEINSILTEYPQEIHEAALERGRHDYEVLEKIEALQAKTDRQFENILTNYPPVTQEALRELIQFPEIISLLHDHLSLAVRAGDHYRRDPQGLLHKADSLNMLAIKQNAEDVEAWKQNLQQNPEAEDELEKASSEYAKENGYTEEEINAQPDPDYINNYTCYPYPYWFGYPVWYPYSYWYPYPFWFDCGFYYNSFGAMIFIGTPSFYFTNWYYYYPEHWYHYPHLCNTYINHYYGPRKSVSRNTLIVRGWVHNNKNYLPKDFITNSTNRTEVIKQVGQLNTDIQKQQKSATIDPIIRDQYFKNNSGKYPALNAIYQTAPETKQKPEIQFPPLKQPPAKLFKPEKPSVPAPKQSETRPYDFNKINKAQEYHRNIWEQSQPATRSQPQQAPRVQPQQPTRQAPTAQPDPARRK